ncbi:MAG: bifunctional folylpolyglutamate synthase/dihydrofolate synthase [Verrucomicrobia bacterium]|nr:bifunctional folylpolyglutamate synthase/dihydrofolate synthase [Verrucomicrobiota bacterium]
MFERTFVTLPLRELLAQPAQAAPCWDEVRRRLAPLEDDPAVRRLPEPPPAPAPQLAVESYLLSLKRRGVRLGLGRMERWVAALGHPESAVPCIHVAGTNGKGSVAAMLAAMLRAAGRRVGLYTSPHLVRLGERVQVDGVMLTDEELAAAVRELAPVAAALVSPSDLDGHPTYFEFMTGLAFRHFARARCDLAVIETGVGGRLDATNVVRPEVSVITSLGMDHAELLGDTLELIAAEKAGIIKAGRPVVLGRLPDAAMAVMRRVAAERGARVWTVAEEFGSDLSRYPVTNLAGDHQRWNAATATLAARLLPSARRPDAAAIERGLQAVVWPGRWQTVALADRTLVLDAAHNAEGATVLEAGLDRLRRETGRLPVVVLGALGLDRARPLLAVACRHARELYLVVPRQSRACSHAELAALVPPDFRGPVRCTTVDELFPAPGTCTAGTPPDPVVVTGSIYLLGEVLVRLDPSRGPLESHLQDF